MAETIKVRGSGGSEFEVDPADRLIAKQLASGALVPVGEPEPETKTRGRAKKAEEEAPEVPEAEG